MEELGIAAMYDIPIIFIIIDNGYLSLIRQQEKYLYNMDSTYYEVSTWYRGQLVDFSHLNKVYGVYAERVDKPSEIQPAFQRAIDAKKAAIIDIIVERETDASMGTSLDNIVIRE
ncbi:unnamed protein product [marine sediment metagenome]|uniref:Thiamine pyrophosphate enzyme TPP-binding domain-containing protein n=1 Tax=marine sediment metagenome TaxID=412755 RepID=X1GA78_9ZZZZ